jgi:hypothetical protein
MHMNQPVLLALVMVVAAAAAPVTTFGQGPTSRDSAGIRIMLSATPATTALIQFDPRPAFVIGGVSGQGPHELWRVAGVHRSEAGDTYASVSGAHQVRQFDANGEYVAGYGRVGGGPNEFHAMASMELYALTDGRIAVDDRFNGRLHVIDKALTESRLVQLRPLPGLGAAGAPRGTFADGSWLAVAPVNGGRVVQTGRLRQFVLSYHRVRADWSGSRELIRVRSRPRVAVRSEGRERLVPVPFTVEPVVVPAGNVVLVSETGEAAIRLFDASGTLRRIHRWSPPSRATRDHRRRYQRHELDAAPPGRRQLVARVHAADLSLPSELPAIQKLIVAEDELVWAERYRLPWEASSIWDVLAPDGRWLTSVEMPANFEVRQIGRDFIAGILRDAFDLESLVVYPLRRTADAGA